jgi:hypothetical protein
MKPILLIICFILITSTACASAAAVTTGSTDPLPDTDFVLVTPNAAASVTPFRPAPLASPLPSFTPLPSATLTSEPLPTLTSLPADAPTDPPVANTPLPTDTSAPVAPTAGDKPQYLITAQMDYANHTVVVSETIVYPNTSSDALPSLLLGVNPMLWTNAFHLRTFSINDQDWGNYSLAGQNLTVTLPAALQPGQAVKLGIGYTLFLPYSNGKFENFGYTNRQTTLIDWYPFVVPYVPGAGWVLPEPYPYGENLVYPEADFRVSLSFTDAAPVVAASAPAALDQNGALTYFLPNARNFSISASPEFLMSSADANGVAIYNYYFPEDAAAAAMALEMTRMAVNTYSASFGSYAHSALTVVETDLNDGLETDGLYFLARGFYNAYPGGVQNNLADIAVHETAHQWWFGAVANNQATEPWLDEAMATYSEHVFYETNYPGMVNWWWNFRVNSKNPSGSVDLRVYDTVTFQGYVGAVYFQGANFFDALRLRIGDADFFAFLRDYYARERGSISSAAAFFAILDQHTSVDYSDLLTTYFYYR